MFVLSPAIIALMVLVPITGYFVVKWVFTKDTESEKRKKAANRMAGTLRSAGLRHLPEFLEDYAVGDWSGMAKKVYMIAEMINGGEEVVLTELNTVFGRVLEAKLATEEGRAFLSAKLKEVTVPAVPAVANVTVG
jgi:hypothetical protein